MNFVPRTATRVIAGVSIAGLITFVGAGLANAEPLPSSVAPQVAASTTLSPANYKGTWALTETITNNSGQDLTLTAAANEYGHWQQRPVDLPEGASETVSSYNDSPHVDATDNITLTYSTPDDNFVTFSGIVSTFPILNTTTTFASDANEAYVDAASITDLDHAKATFNIIAL